MFGFIKMFFRFYNRFFSKDKLFAKRLRSLIGFTPSNIGIFKLAFYHKSASSEKLYAVQSNERLEYLGDAVLGTIVAEYLFKKYPNKDEGFLTKMRSKIVKRQSLNKIADKMGLDVFLNQYNNTRLSRSMLGNALEALVGAVYIESGYQQTRRYVIQKILRGYLDIHELESFDDNYKSQLLEWCQKNGQTVSYKMLAKYKFEKRDRFKVAVLIDGKKLAAADDFNKKSAEQTASEKAMQILGLLDEKSEKPDEDNSRGNKRSDKSRRTPVRNKTQTAKKRDTSSRNSDQKETNSRNAENKKVIKSKTTRKPREKAKSKEEKTTASGDWSDLKVDDIGKEKTKSRNTNRKKSTPQKKESPKKEELQAQANSEEKPVEKKPKPKPRPKRNTQSNRKKETPSTTEQNDKAVEAKAPATPIKKTPRIVKKKASTKPKEEQVAKEEAPKVIEKTQKESNSKAEGEEGKEKPQKNTSRNNQRNSNNRNNNNRKRRPASKSAAPQDDLEEIEIPVDLSEGITSTPASKDKPPMV